MSSTEGVGLLGEARLGEAIRGKLTFFSDLFGDLGVRMKGVGCVVQGSGLRVQGVVCRVQGVGCRA